MKNNILTNSEREEFAQLFSNVFHMFRKQDELLRFLENGDEELDRFIFLCNLHFEDSECDDPGVFSPLTKLISAIADTGRRGRRGSF